jgi:hypothetical protein
MRLAVFGLLLGLVMPAFGPAETREIEVPKRSLAEIRLDVEPGDSVDIDWEARDPIRLPARSYEGGRVFVFWSGDGDAVLWIVSDVIDWDARTRTKTRWLVTLGDGDGPDDPDDPPDPPDPPPDDDEPPNAFRVGKMAYDQAMLIPAAARAKASQIATIYASGSSKLAGLSGDAVTLTSMAAADIHYETSMALGEDREAWRQWRLAMKKAFEDSWRQSSRTKDHTVGMFREISEALNLLSVSKSRPVVDRAATGLRASPRATVRVVRQAVPVQYLQSYCPSGST